MSASLRDIESKVLELPLMERASLAERLLSSLDSGEQHRLDEKWAEEAESRIRAYEAGEMTASDASEVSARIEKKFVS
jgi:putative addiction module component (TIGR02574 family)